ncbi:MAG: hypothetical protein CL518_01485 [Actinobacteria bacterium]|nr:hypothetical protein [Actinomycetota bacterium]
MNKKRLPKSTYPNRYEIELDVDLDKFSYTGRQKVDLNVVETTNKIVLNSVGIQVTKAKIQNTEQDISLEVSYIEEDEKIVFESEEVLSKGLYELYLEFNSEITNDLKGFYKSSYMSEGGEKKWIATTQFEPTAARSAFPCWDEPEYKAIFSMTIITDEKYLRVSNEMVIEEEKIENNKLRTKFADSMKMSSYLVAFVIGDLEATVVGKSKTTDIRIIHRPGFSHQTSYAGTAAIKLLDFFEDYYKIPYPGTKLDLIAIPDFAMGAMENIGAVTFRENLLLFDKDKATRSELDRSITVIAHELAHMWFGDLVTMKWWDGIWLNEAFASLMEVIASYNTYPEFKQWNAMNMSRTAGFSIDSLENSRPVEFDVETPDQAEEMFDVLTYEKGSTVLRMFQMFIGEEAFQNGVEAYLNKFKFKNTNSSDLWDALSEASNQPLNKILPYWIREKGYPFLQVDCSNNYLTIKQKPFLLRNINTDKKSIKPVPVQIKFLDTGNEEKFLLDETEKVIDLENLGKVPHVNSGGWGFFHTFYDDEVFENILKNFNNLNDLEKYRLLEDKWMQFKKAPTNIKDFYKFLMFFKNEKDEDIWIYMSSIIATLANLFESDNSDSFRDFVRDLTDELHNELGFEVKKDEELEIKEVRDTINKLRAKNLDDDDFIKKFSDIFKEDKMESISEGTFFSSILFISALDETNKIETFLEKFENAESPQMQGRYRGVLGQVRDKNASKKIVEFMLDGRIRGADCPYILASMITNKYIGKKSWGLIKENFNELLNVMPDWTSSRILDALPAIYDEEFANDIKSFIKKNPLPSSEKLAAQKLERLEANIEFMDNLKEVNNET